MAIICVASTEAGVGKSTLASHIAHGSALTGLSTLLVDFTDNCSITKQFGINPGSHPTASALIDARGELGKVPSDVVYEGVRENLDVIAADERLGRTVLRLYAPDREYMLVSAFHQFATAYDCVVIDTSPRLNLLTRCCLFSADVVVYPVTSSVPTVEGLQSFLGLAEYFSLSPCWTVARTMLRRGLTVRSTELEDTIDSFRARDLVSLEDDDDALPELPDIRLLQSQIHRFSLPEHAGTLFDIEKANKETKTMQRELIDMVEELQTIVSTIKPASEREDIAPHIARRLSA